MCMSEVSKICAIVRTRAYYNEGEKGRVNSWKTDASCEENFRHAGLYMYRSGSSEHFTLTRIQPLL